MPCGFVVLLQRINAELWDNLEQIGIEWWWRWRPPLMLISLRNLLNSLKIPTKIPTNDRFRRTLYLVLYRIRLNKFVYISQACAKFTLT